MAEQTEAESRPQRRSEVDWLRVLAVLLLLFFHSACVFCYGEYHLKNNQLNWAFTFFVLFVMQFHMQLFFFIAGASTCLALNFRSGGQYVQERFRRLGIPFLFGVLFIVPPQVYFEALSGTGYLGHYFARYFSETGTPVPPFFEFYGWLFTYRQFHWHHLWFVLYLFIFSAVALPLFLSLKRRVGQRLTSWLAGFFEKPGAIFLLAIPLAAFELLLRPGSPAGLVGWLNLVNDLPNLVYYFMFFVFGYLVYSNAGFGRAVERHGIIALVMALVFTAGILTLFRTGNMEPWGTRPPVYLYTVIHSFASWCWIVALLSLGRKFLSFSNRLLRYTSEAAYPFYILHQTVILAIAYYVVQWNTDMVPKYLVVSFSSLVTTAVIYDLLVRRTNVTRFFFGMKPKPKKEMVPEERVPYWRRQESG